jgi:predicted nucleic-acid-binding protein
LIGLDANVLVRYLTDDDPVQSPRARNLIERRLTADEPGFVGLVALVETVWVLRRTYRYTQGQLVDAIRRLLRIESLVVDREREVFVAMTILEDGLGDFADALIAELAMSAGCSHTVTFDQRASRLPGFALL